MIGDRIKQARLAAGLSQDQVVSRLADAGHELTKAGLSKYETRKSQPKQSLLVALARVLGVRTSYFLEETTISWVAFRKQSKLRVSRAEQIKAHVQRIAEGQIWLQGILYANKAAKLPSFTPPGTVEEVEEVAESVRSKWDLGKDAIDSVVSVLEANGVVVVSVPDEGADHFDGLSGWMTGNVPVIVLKRNCPSDRARFNAAHELAHLVLDSPNLTTDIEPFAHRFAAAFLVPAQVARFELGNQRRHLSLDEVGTLKQRFGLSMAAWIRRAYDLEIISRGLYKSLFIELGRRGFRKCEPDEFACKSLEEPARLRQMCLRAVAEGIISREKAAQICPGIIHDIEAPPKEHLKKQPSSREILALPRAARQALLKLAADEVADVYHSNPELAAFDAFGEDDIYVADA